MLWRNGIRLNRQFLCITCIKKEEEIHKSRYTSKNSSRNYTNLTRRRMIYFPIEYDNEVE